MVITEFNTDNCTVFSGRRKYQLTISHYTPYQYFHTLRFNSNNRNKVFSRGVGIRYENGDTTIRYHSRPKRLNVSFCSFARRQINE